MKSEGELIKELRDIESSILIACQNESIECIDLIYLAQRINDIKQALRIINASK